ncbi:MAG: type 1 glutamine amidotransferase domain-containing protein [Chloroflexi bacterium]|nr:type 1 glutamine amidotransferase domain-containing protein [Chloroflexota bacterium]
MSDTVVVVLSENGFWIEELLKPLARIKDAGYGVQFVTPTGKLPYPDPASLDPNYKDPPLDRPVTFVEDLREQAKRYGLDFSREPKWQEVFRDLWEPLFRDRISLEEWMPRRPYLNDERYLDRLEAYYEKRDEGWKRIDEFAGLLMVGGSGPMFDMVGNGPLHNLILGFYYAAKPIAAECYAVTCLAMARELDDRTSILEGRHVTGHTVEYDYTAGWAAYQEGRWVPFTGGAPFVLEYILRDAVRPGGRFHGNVGRKLSVIVDYPFITSRSVGESDLCGEKLVEALEGEKNGNRLLRYGW